MKANQKPIYAIITKPNHHIPTKLLARPAMSGILYIVFD